MKLIRKVLGKAIIFFDRTFGVAGVERAPELQQKLDVKTKAYSLYQFEACPFCVKVRREIKRLNLKVELRDAKEGTAYGEELLKEGGMKQVPCLRIEESTGSVKWLYESADIIQFLKDAAA